MGELAFRKIQYGLEDTAAHGTAVAATARFPGTVVVPPDRKPSFPVEATGLRVRAQRSQVNQILADRITLKMDDGVFQKLPMLFNIGLKGGVTGAEVTTGQHDYLWDFSHSLTAANAPDSITLEYGDDTQAYEIEFCMARRYKISGSLGDDASVAVEAELFGKQITATTFTNSIAMPASYTGMIANVAKLYIDPAWASLGTTLVENTLVDYDVEILTGVYPKFRAAGVKTMTGYGESFPDVLATFTFEGNSTADGQFDVFQAGTPKAVKFILEGPAIGTGGKHNLTIDMYGTWEEVQPLAKEADGDNLHTMVFHTHGDALASPHHFAVKVTTDSNTL